ncbi:transposable element Tc1 transposase [Trichonephila clavipes]|nr:transposable element Tc1 transposase [Trichonephila clavipes]
MHCDLGYLSTTEKMRPRRIRAHYEQLSKFERDRIIGLKEAVGQIGESLVIWVEAMRLLEDAGKNGWTVADFSFMMRRIPLPTCPDDHRRYVWRSPVQLADPAFTIACQTGLQPGIMVWCANSFNNHTPVMVIRGTLTAQWYADDILRTVLLPFLLQYPGLIFQQDNAKPYEARVAMNYVIVVKHFPGQPDLFNRACLAYDKKATASTREC